MEPTLYFAYGSNLSLTQMHARCPASIYVGIGRLQGYRWIINTRGYANVVPVSPTVVHPVPSDNPTGPTSLTVPDTGTDPTEEDTYVYGLVYSLQPADEKSLDWYEGVPEDYAKESLAVEVWETGTVTGSGKVVSALVYVDGLRTTEGRIREEYVFRMRRAFREAVERGVPRGWMEGVFGRRFGVEEDVGVGSQEGKR